MKQAGFRVLVTAFMPAVLVEIGFGTNPAEAAYMSNPAKMDELSGAIADGVLEYLKRYERRVSSTGVVSPGGLAPEVSAHRGALAVEVAGLQFQNPIVLAAGTAAYGRELDGIVNLRALGGLVTKAVSPEPRPGAPAPRVAEFDGGMINAVGLANPGCRGRARASICPGWRRRSLIRGRSRTSSASRRRNSPA